jgi:hypothetical protein
MTQPIVLPMQPSQPAQVPNGPHPSSIISGPAPASPPVLYPPVGGLNIQSPAAPNATVTHPYSDSPLTVTEGHYYGRA